MSFGKFLAAGKSIMSGRPGAAYRENKRVFVPKFEPAKNPFAKPVPTAGGSPAAGAADTSVKLSVNAPLVAQPVARLAARPGNWSARLNPISMLRGKPAGPVKAVTAVQTELSLEMVKVVHNDLRDADVEVVPLKSRPARTAGAAEPASAWSELGTGFFEANAV